jgi:hypothetical protein
LRECPHCGKCFDPVVTHCSEDGVELTFSIPASRLIAERYRLNKRIGEGGMGAVYQATDLPRPGRSSQADDGPPIWRQCCSCTL